MEHRNVENMDLRYLNIEESFFFFLPNSAFGFVHTYTCNLVYCGFFLAKSKAGLGNTEEHIVL